MAVPVSKKLFSPEEYLRLEAAAEQKNEFHAGEILAMSGGTFEHSRINANLIASLSNRMRGSACFVLDSNMRVRLAPDDRYVYPDCTLICEDPLFDPRDINRTTIINPRVVFEVLSDSTEAYDRGAKFSSYRGLPSLDEYVLVSQSQPLIETFGRRPDGTWLFSAWQGLEAVAKMQCVQTELPLAEVYQGIFPTRSR